VRDNINAKIKGTDDRVAGRTSTRKMGSDTRDDVKFKKCEQEGEERNIKTKADRVEIDTTRKANSSSATGSLKSLNTVTPYCVS